MRIKVTLPTRNSAANLSQFLDTDGTLNGHTFLLGPHHRNADAWFVIDNVDPNDSCCNVPKERIFFVTAEHIYSDDHYTTPQWEAFCNQFSGTYSSYLLPHKKHVVAPPFLPWMVNANHGTALDSHPRDLGYLRTMEPPPKTHALSVFCSSKTMTPGHRLRLYFVRTLKNYFGKDLDWFGNGVSSLDVKWDGLSQYIATISIENAIKPDVYSEKLIDPLLTHTVPLYSGAPNINKYFSLPEAWLLDARDINGSIQKIKTVISSPDLTQDLEHVRANRELALDRNHFLNRMAAIAEGNPAISSPKKINLTTAKIVPTSKTPARIAKSVLRKLLGGL